MLKINDEVYINPYIIKNIYTKKGEDYKDYYVMIDNLEVFHVNGYLSNIKNQLIEEVNRIVNLIREYKENDKQNTVIDSSLYEGE